MTLPIWLSDQEKAICEYLIASQDFSHFLNFQSISREIQYRWDKEIFALEITENILLIYWCDDTGFSEFSIIINGCLLVRALPMWKPEKTAKYKALLLRRKIKSVLANWENIRIRPHRQLAFC